FEQTFHGKPLAFLDSAASSQKPRQMLDAMREFYETSYANVHRGVYQLAERATAALEGSREKVRELLNAPAAREVIFVRNATEGLNLVAYAWGLNNLGPGDIVLVPELRPQDVRAERDRRALGPRGAARAHGAVPARRAHDPIGALRGDDLGRAAAQVRGRHRADGRSRRLRCRDRLSPRDRLRRDLR